MRSPSVNIRTPHLFIKAATRLTVALIPWSSVTSFSSKASRIAESKGDSCVLVQASDLRWYCACKNIFLPETFCRMQEGKLHGIASAFLWICTRLQLKPANFSRIDFAFVFVSFSNLRMPLSLLVKRWLFAIERWEAFFFLLETNINLAEI